jgi:large subunit ribosomal protein L24
MSMPLHASNAMILDPKKNKGTRVGKKKIGDKMVRIAKKSNQEI